MIMKTLTLILFCLLACTQLNAQELKSFDSTVKDSPYPTHIRIFYNRFSATGMVIDLFSVDKINYAGVLTNYTNRYKDTTINMVVTQTFDRTYSYKLRLDSTASTKTALHLLASRQDTLSEEAISFPKNWMIDDCGSYIFEFKTNNRYIRQSLFCPEVRALTIDDPSQPVFRNIICPNLEYLSIQLQLDSFKYRFGNSLPESGWYTYNGPAGYGKPIKHVAKSDDEWKSWERLNLYMRSVRDTLKRYLENKLANVFIPGNELDCPNEFYLHFSKNSKLIRITTNSELWKRDEISRYKQCKRQIFAAFRKIDMPFMKPGQDFEVMLRSGGDEVEVFPELRADH